MNPTKRLWVLPVTLLFGASFAFADGIYGLDGGWQLLNDDCVIGGTSPVTVENKSVTRHGGAIYADGNLTISGNFTFSNNSAGGKGGAIYADDNVFFVGTGTVISFSGNTAGGVSNDIFFEDNDDIMIIRDAGTYTFGGGIDASRGSSLQIGTGATVTFGAASVTTIGGTTSIEGGAVVTFESGSVNTFAGGLHLVGSGSDLSLGGVTTIGRRILLSYDAATDKFSEIDFSGADSVTLIAGTQLSVSGNISAKDLINKQYTVITGATSEQLATLSGQQVADAVLYRTVTDISTSNELILKTVRKTTEEATAAVGGNADAAVALYDENTILDVASYDQARENTRAATGEIVASDAYARLRRTFVALQRAEQFLANEIAGTAFRKPASGGTAVSRRETSQAATGEIPGGAQSAPASEKSWEFALAYSGMSGEVSSTGGFDSYDYSSNTIWLGLKKGFRCGTAGVMLESGNTSTESYSSEIDAQEIGASAFFFIPITNGGTYAFLQTRFAKSDNDFFRSFAGKHYVGEFSSWTWSVQGEIGTNFELTDWLRLNPYTSVAYAITDSERFSDAGNTYSGADAYDVEIKPGFRLRADFSIADLPTFVSLGAAWTYLCIDDRLDIEVSRGNTTASVLGNRGEQSFVEASLDAGADLTENISIGAGYAYADGSDAKEHRLYLRGSYRF
ncbi:MAG: autotransporter domain-containing protein [Opitutales bacterium]|nr:autotransporter domain-containing protein [Opitutales bacterium]